MNVRRFYICNLAILSVPDVKLEACQNVFCIYKHSSFCDYGWNFIIIGTCDTFIHRLAAVWIINLLGIRGDNEDSSKTNNHNNHNRKTKLLRIINDRKILEFLLSHDGRNIMRANGIDGLADIDIINHLYILSIKKVKCDTTTSKAQNF